jgi:pimeloyl-ACP methyl ester carboxylesterase
MPNPPATHPAPESWAEVRANDLVMRYRRLGAGPAVVLLDGPRAPNRRELVAALAGDFRLILPELPADGADTSSRLVDFLEGLGAASVAVIASTRYCTAALELALRDAEQVARVVLLPEGDGDANPCDEALVQAARAACTPVLVIPSAMASDEAQPLIANFLAGGEPPPG